jgi:hypothetical protein
MEGSPRMIPRFVLIPVAAVIIAAGGWDGNYSGRLTLVGDGAMACSKAAPVQMNIAGGVLTYHHFSNATFTATVQSDGSFKDTQHNLYGGSRTMIVQTLTGQISGTTITADANSQYCNYHLVLHRQG